MYNPVKWWWLYRSGVKGILRLRSSRPRMGVRDSGSFLFRREGIVWSSNTIKKACKIRIPFCAVSWVLDSGPLLSVFPSEMPKQLGKHVDLLSSASCELRSVLSLLAPFSYTLGIKQSYKSFGKVLTSTTLSHNSCYLFPQ